MPAVKETGPGATQAGASQLQTWQDGQNQLQISSKHGTGSGAQPQIDLALAKEGFAQWLRGVHAQPDLHEQHEGQSIQAVPGLGSRQNSSGVAHLGQLNIPDV